MKKLMTIAASIMFVASISSAQDYSDDNSTTYDTYDTGVTDVNSGQPGVNDYSTDNYSPTDQTNSNAAGEVSTTSANTMMNRTNTEMLNFFRFGPATMINTDASGAGIYLSAGRLFITNPQAAIRISGDGAFSGANGEGTSSYLSANLGGVYYIDETDTAPHAFADLGYGYADAPDIRSANGFTLGVGVGTAFFRSSDMQMDISARYQLMMTSNDQGAPSVLALLLGLNFG